MSFFKIFLFICFEFRARKKKDPGKNINNKKKAWHIFFKACYNLVFRIPSLTKDEGIVFNCFLDIDECSASVCHVNANCQNNDGSYVCACTAGYTGDGKSCTGEFKGCGGVLYSVGTLLAFPIVL